MDKVLMANVDQCTGCKICELVCSMNREGEYRPSQSYIRILRNKDLDVNLPALALQCLQRFPDCTKCAEFCPTKCLEFVTLKEGVLLRKQTRIGSIPAPILGESIIQP